MTHLWLHLYSYHCSYTQVLKWLWRVKVNFNMKFNKLNFFYMLHFFFISKSHIEFYLQPYWVRKCCSQKWSCPKIRNGSPYVSFCCCACLSIGNCSASHLHFQWRGLPRSTAVPEEIGLWSKLGIRENEFLNSDSQLVNSISWESSFVFIPFWVVIQLPLFKWKYILFL